MTSSRRPTTFSSIMLFLSSYSPLFVILIIKDYDECAEYLFKTPILSYLLIVVIIVSIIMTLLISSNAAKKCITEAVIIDLKIKNENVVSYSIPYLLSFIGVRLSDNVEVISFLIFMIVLFILTVKSRTEFINPVLVFANYDLYEVTYKIGDQQPRTTLALTRDDVDKNSPVVIAKVTSGIYFVKLNQSDADA